MSADRYSYAVKVSHDHDGPIGWSAEWNDGIRHFKIAANTPEEAIEELLGVVSQALHSARLTKLAERPQ